MIWNDLGSVEEEIMSASTTDKEEAFCELQRENPEKDIFAIRRYDPAADD